MFNDPTKSAFQGDQPQGDHGYARNVIPGPIKSACGVPEDGPASRDENYSSGKGKDKKIKSESKVTKSSNKVMTF